MDIDTQVQIGTVVIGLIIMFAVAAVLRHHGRVSGLYEFSAVPVVEQQPWAVSQYVFLEPVPTTSTDDREERILYPGIFDNREERIICPGIFDKA